MEHYTHKPIIFALKDLGARFVAYRLARNVTQTELAKEAGISRSTLVRLEQDGAGTLDTVLRVLRAFGMGDRIDLLVPDVLGSPNDPLSGKRQRARGQLRPPRRKRTIRWGDEG